MVTQRKEFKLDPVQKELVNTSVKAQNILVKNGNSAYKTTDDLNINISIINNQASVNPATNATTNVSQEDQSKIITNLSTLILSLFSLDKSYLQEHGDNLLFPSIRSIKKNRDQSPNLKGYLDISQTSHKMKQHQVEQRLKEMTEQRGGIKTQLFPEGLSAIFKEEKSRYKSQEKSAGSKMNPKVLETWINETLQDAEHLDIPGVILKPEHKNPISRYGIDRLSLTNSGIPNELVDRVFRALFVYSVGFYELIKKCLQHCDKKYSIITNIWKVFSILLEYCCKTDYRMLISEISKEHKAELEKVEREMQLKFYEQQENEKLLRNNIEILQKYNEDLEKQRNQEMQARLKLEEEYMQNTKNHEEEVQLRLKFESKLNNMHSVHRELETKYKRLLGEYSTLINTNDQLNHKQVQHMDEITKLKTIQAENESKISYNEEKMNAIQREMNIKAKQVTDIEVRYTRIHEELDYNKAKLQEAQKDITESKLRIDMFESQIDSLKSEKQHLQYEVKETKNLLEIYEKKTGSLMVELNKVNLEFQDSKREIIGFNEIQKEREERLEKMKSELGVLRLNHEQLDLEHGTLQIQYEKVKEQYESTKTDLNDVIEKLHITNKVRHETEMKLDEEMSKNKNMNDILKEKDDINNKRVEEIEELDKKVIELERQCEALEIKKVGIERQFELTKKQLNEKIINMNEVLATEKETRETWIERYEKEQREHTQTNAQLLQVRSQLKDQVLATRNAEIKLQSQQRANDVIQEANARLQDNLNETLAQNENLEREINTQKELMKQMDISKKEYIQKLKDEFDEIEEGFNAQLNMNDMISEDYHAQAQENLLKFNNLTLDYEELQEDFDLKIEEIHEKENQIIELKQELEQEKMQQEDVHVQFMGQTQHYNEIKIKVDQYQEENIQLTEQVEELKEAKTQKEQFENQVSELKKEIAQMRHKNEREKDQGEPKKRGRGASNAGAHNKSKQREMLSNQSSVATGKETSDQNTQTMLGGQRIDQMLKNAVLNQQDLKHGQKIGGGGEIRRKPTRKTNPNMQGNPILGVAGQPQPIQQKTSMQANLGIKEMVDQVLDSEQAQSEQIYPQTTTHQTQRLMQFPQAFSNQPLPRAEDGPQTQHPTPRNDQQQFLFQQSPSAGDTTAYQQQFASVNLNEISQDGDVSQQMMQNQMMGGTTKKDRSGFGFQQRGKDIQDNQTASSIMNSSNTLNNTLGQIGQQRMGHNVQPLNLQDQYMYVDNSVIISPGGSQSFTMDDSAREFPGGMPFMLPQQQQNYINNEQNVIYEQLNEDEERKTPNHRSRMSNTKQSSQGKQDSTLSQQRRKSSNNQNDRYQNYSNQRKASSQTRVVRATINKLHQTSSSDHNATQVITQYSDNEQTFQNFPPINQSFNQTMLPSSDQFQQRSMNNNVIQRPQQQMMNTQPQYIQQNNNQQINMQGTFQNQQIQQQQQYFQGSDGSTRQQNQVLYQENQTGGFPQFSEGNQNMNDGQNYQSDYGQEQVYQQYQPNLSGQQYYQDRQSDLSQQMLNQNQIPNAQAQNIQQQQMNYNSAPQQQYQQVPNNQMDQDTQQQYQTQMVTQNPSGMRQQQQQQPYQLQQQQAQIPQNQRPQRQQQQQQQQIIPQNNSGMRQQQQYSNQVPQNSSGMRQQPIPPHQQPPQSNSNLQYQSTNQPSAPPRPQIIQSQSQQPFLQQNQPIAQQRNSHNPPTNYGNAQFANTPQAAHSTQHKFPQKSPNQHASTTNAKSFHQDHQSFASEHSQKRKISLKGDVQSDRLSEQSAQHEDQRITPTQKYEAKLNQYQDENQVRSNDGRSQESIEEIQYKEDSKKNQSFLPEISNKNQSQYQIGATKRMKVDIIDNSSIKKSLNSNASLLSPTSAVQPGLSIQNQMNTERNQPGDNRQVKGKSSIRTLIKSAATRDQ